MSRPSWMVLWFVLVCGPGCALTDDGTNWLTGKQEGQTEPDVSEEKWTNLSKEAKRHRGVVKEDPLDRLLWSEKAREINQSIGYE